MSVTRNSATVNHYHDLSIPFFILLNSDLPNNCRPYDFSTDH